MKRIRYAAIALICLVAAATLTSCKSGSEANPSGKPASGQVEPIFVVTGLKNEPSVGQRFSLALDELLGRLPAAWNPLIITPSDDSPILVRGGSLSFHNSAGWTQVSSTVYSTPLPLNNPVAKQLILDGTDSPGSISLGTVAAGVFTPGQPWKVAILFRTFKGIKRANGPEMDICSNLKSGLCDLTYQAPVVPSNMVYVVLPDSTTGALAMDLNGLDSVMAALRYKLKDCKDDSGATTADFLCEHPGTITITMGAPAGTTQPSTTEVCTGGACDIRIQTKTPTS